MSGSRGFFKTSARKNNGILPRYNTMNYCIVYQCMYVCMFVWYLGILPTTKCQLLSINIMQVLYLGGTYRIQVYMELSSFEMYPVAIYMKLSSFEMYPVASIHETVRY